MSIKINTSAVSLAVVVVMGVFFFFTVAHAEQIDAISSIEHGGLEIFEGDEVFRNEIKEETAFWRFNFSWPYHVQNQRALFVVFRGEFGALEGGVPAEKVNFSAQLQSWGAGANSLVKSFIIPQLRPLNTEPGTYTLLVAEAHHPDNPRDNIDVDQYIEWFASGGTSGIEPIKYDFLTFNFLKYAECCSSVVFLPGLKGSVLVEGGDRLWPPEIFTFKDDVAALALTEEGESVNFVVVDGILEKFLFTPVYEGFVSFMNDLVSDGTIHEWYPAAYDWRFSPEHILDNGIKTSSNPSGFDLLEKIETLAKESDTGQVTLVAHSMGGLLGKAIIKRFEEAGKEGSIDSFVMVGSPQLGTPQAIGALLHGDNEGIPGSGAGIFFGAIVNPLTARSVSQNMQSVYDLLPSPHYFEEVSDPVVSFDENASFTDAWRGAWGTELTTFSEFFSFLTGQGVLRTGDSNNLLVPEVLRADLLNNAVDFHGEYDTYEFPGSIRVVQVAGWGLPTVKRIVYRDRHSSQSYDVETTVEGDKTVVYPSAVSSVGEKYFFNIFDFNELLESNAQHRNLLSTVPLKSLLSSVFEEKEITGIGFISETKPPISDANKQLLVSAHSPVILGVFDEDGNFTGIDPNQDLSADILFVTEDIPGSSFLGFGSGQYIFLPKNGNYTFIFEGIGEGPTTIEVKAIANDESTSVATYTDIPVTQNMKASFTINSTSPENTPIELDTDSDDTTDETILPDDFEEELSLTEQLEELIQTVELYIEGSDIRRFGQRLITRNLERTSRIFTRLEEDPDNKRLQRRAEHRLRVSLIGLKIHERLGRAPEEDTEEIRVQIQDMLDRVREL